MALSVRVSPVGVGNNDDAALRIENRAASLPASPLSQVVVAADDEEEEEPDEEESIEAPRPWWVHMLPQWVVDFLDRIENSSAMGLSRIDPYVVIKLKPWKVRVGTERVSMYVCAPSYLVPWSSASRLRDETCDM
jgi:hypothetical protein